MVDGPPSSSHSDGISGYSLDSDSATPGVQPTTTTTNGSGVYLFSDVGPGDYQVVQSQPTGYLSQSGVDGANDNVIGAENAIVVVSGITNNGNNFVEELDNTKADNYSDFVTENSSSLGGETALGDNPDGDIYPNALEYAFCLEPGSGVASDGEFSLSKAPDGSVTAEFLRPRGGLTDVTYTLEGASNLATPTVWVPFTSIVPQVSTSGLPSNAERVLHSNIQNATELSSGVNGVVRLKVEVDANGCGTITPDEVFYSEVFGWQCVDFLDYQCSTFSNPFTEKPVFSGTFPGMGVLTDSVDFLGNVTLDVSDSALGADLTSVVGSGGSHYLLITSGLLEGERFDILSGGVDTLTLVNDPGIFPEADGVESLNTSDGVPADSELNGASYQVVRYQTVDDLFDPETVYAGEEDSNPSDATRLFFYNNRTTTPGFEALMLNGTNSTNSSWIYTNDLVFQTDQGSLRIDPCGGNWIHPKSSGNPSNPALVPPIHQLTAGMIADFAQACPLNAGFNLTGAMWPLDQTPAGANGRNLTVAAQFDGGIDPSNSTELLFWEGDQVVDDIDVTVYREGYENYMLLDGGGMQNWIDINDPVLKNQDELLLLESHRAVFLKLNPGDEKDPHVYPLPAY